MRLESTPWKLGHRGACGYAPENTLLSFEKAISLGVDGIEFDIQLSKDGVPIVIHDDTLNRTTNGTGAVSDHTAAQLKQFDAGQGQQLLTLEETLDAIAGRTRLFIELKAEHSTRPVVELIMQAVMHKSWRYEQLSVISFDHNQIAEARDLCEHIRTGALIVGIPTTLAKIAEEAGAWSINPGVHHITRALIDDAHRRNLRVLTWTVNDEHYKHKALDYGVDGIFSDYPDRL
jgi:glycerophosphoryl diester phosphodiesterase